MNEYFYQEVYCRPGSEISVGFLMSRAMKQIHLELVRVAEGRAHCPIGISFPNYRSGRLSTRQDSAVQGDTFTPRLPPIGDSIRLFTRAAAQLEKVELAMRLVRMRDYLEIGDVRLLKRKNFAWSLFKRHQPNGSVEAKIRRRMMRHGISLEEARAYFAKPLSSSSDLPYLDMVSHSTQQCFRLFIEKQTVDLSRQEAEQNWEFSTYGLSASVPVPDF